MASGRAMSWPSCTGARGSAAWTRKRRARPSGREGEMSDPNCIFCKIVRGDIPAKKIHDDDDVIAFHDIRPQAPVHFLIIPKVHVATLYDAVPANIAAFGKMLAIAGKLAREAGAAQ